MRAGEDEIRGPIGATVAIAVAAVAAAAVIVGSGDRDLQSKVATVALALAIFGPSAMAGLHLAERRPRLAAVGAATLAIGFVGFVTVAVHIASESLYLGGDWHLQGIFLALTLATGQLSLVLAYDRNEDPVALRLLSLGVALALLAFGVLAAYEASEGASQVSPSVFAVLAATYLAGLGALVAIRVGIWLERRGRLDATSLLDHVVIAVGDRGAAVRFYRLLLGAEVVEQDEGRIAFRVGDQLLNVHDPGTDAAPLAREPVRPGNSDLCFVWPGTPEQAVALVREVGGELVAGPIRRHGAAGVGTSVYTRDPDGSLIELISYGPG